MIERIESTAIWKGRAGGLTWFHPRACVVPRHPHRAVVMTCQTISGSDYFGAVCWAESVDGGQTWSDPQPIPWLGRVSRPDGLVEGVCDVVPEYHPQTDTVLAVGHNVYYARGALTRPNEGRFTVYAVRSPSRVWSERQRLVWDDPRATAIYTAGCAQRVTLENGEVIVPLSFGPMGRPDRAVGTVRCSFDGARLEIKECGNALHLAVGRGLLEPSLTRLRGRFYMTIRAEDERGYVTSSADGLQWSEIRPWRWDDGEAVVMSTTQQRWLTHSEGLYLVYTRRSAENANVMRWRAPLYVAQVDQERLCLKRSSEQVVLPMIGDGLLDPDHVARMGNFHVVNVSPVESWVTVGETLPHDGWRGDTLLARIGWSAPNELAPALRD